LEIEKQSDLCFDLIDVLSPRARTAGELESKVVLVNPEVVVDAEHGVIISRKRPDGYTGKRPYGYERLEAMNSAEGFPEPQ